MILSDLRDLVISAVKSPGITPKEVDAALNRGIRFISGRVLLPGLEAKSTLNTALDGSPVPMPDDFQRNLFGCSDGIWHVGVVSSVGLMQEKYSNLFADYENGPVDHVCVSAGDLIYQPVPYTEKTLTLRYYKKPAIVAADKEPDMLPEDMQEDLLVEFALWVLFRDVVESAVEGSKPNTKERKQNFYEALATLKKRIKHGQSRPKPSRGKGWI